MGLESTQVILDAPTAVVVEKSTENSQSDSKTEVDKAETPRTATRELEYPCDDAVDDDGSFGGKGNVILRVECLTSKETKVLLNILWFAILVGLTYTLALFSLKIVKGTTLGSDYFLTVEWPYIVNVSVAAVCLLLLLLSVAQLSVRGIKAIKQRTQKSLRQRIVVVQLCSLLLSIIDNVFFMAPSIKALSNDCWFYATFGYYTFFYASMGIRWTAWNTVFAIFVMDVHDLCPPVKSVIKKVVQGCEGCAAALGCLKESSAGLCSSLKLVGQKIQSRCSCCKPGDKRSFHRTKSKALIMGEGMWHHVHIFVLWAIFEAVLLTLIIKGLRYRENSQAYNIKLPSIENADDILKKYPTWIGVDNVTYVDVTEYVTIPQQAAGLSLYGKVVSYFLYGTVSTDVNFTDLYGDLGFVAYFAEVTDGVDTALVYRLWPIATLVDFLGTPQDVVLWTSDFSAWQMEDLVKHAKEDFSPKFALWFGTASGVFDSIISGGNRTTLEALLYNFQRFDLQNQYQIMQLCYGVIGTQTYQQISISTTNAFRRAYGLPDCKDNFECNSGVKCSSDPWTIAFNIVSGAIVLTYFVIYIAYLIHAHRFLGSMAYNKMRGYHIRWRFQVRMQCIAFGGVFLTLLFLSYSNMSTCNSQWFTIMGYAPMEFIMSILVCISAYMANPMMVDEEGHVTSVGGFQYIPQTSAQEFAWTCAERPMKIIKRGYPNEPMFCVELMLKLLYWSSAVYGDSKIHTIEVCLRMFGLDSYKKIHDKETDTNVLMGWSKNTVVVAFRGTASTKNAITDAKAWITKHQVRSTDSHHHRSSRVHKGFLSAWTAVQDEVLKELQGHLTAMHNNDPDTKLTVFITGHSLGGALATLASFYFAEIIKFDIPHAADHIHLSCYTFGAPQVGNKSFVKLYDQYVADTWMVVNDDDAVPKMTNWLGLYSYAGHRVSFNKAGDMIVRPSWVEMIIMKLPGASSAKDHMTGAYAVAMGNAFLAQYDKSKAFKGGLWGLQRLWDDQYVQQILRQCCEVDCTAEDGMTEARRKGEITDKGNCCGCFSCGC